MLRPLRLPVLLVLAYASAYAQTAGYPYFLKTFAGTFPLGDGGPAKSALLYYPYAAIPDASGNLYILDSDNAAIRKVDIHGTITTFAPLKIEGFDMKMGPDGSLYVAGYAQVIKVSPSGVTSVVAGTGTLGYGGDGGPAISAQVGSAQGVAVDAAGNTYFTDTYSRSMRVRMVTPDGKINTIAGTGSFGYNGDNQLATNATLYYPVGIAVDNAGNIYVADSYNDRIRKFTVGGSITTVVGNGNYGQPANGPALSQIGTPSGIWVDAAGNLFFTDGSYDVIMKVTAAGNMARIAGNFSGYGTPGDGVATSISLDFPSNVSTDSAGNVFFTEDTHRVRKLTSDGMVNTIAGALHYAGDNGPAPSAILNNPSDIVFDGLGNAFIVDSYNYRVRKVDSHGIITTFAGTGVPGLPSSGAPAVSSNLPYLHAIAIDSLGALYLTGYAQVYKITAAGTLTVIAGNGSLGNGGDGGPAISATFQGLTGIAVDSAGNVYVADSNSDRVRVITASTGVITAFAGAGTRGYAGDGSLATSAKFDFSSRTPLAVDSKNNLYIGDGNNARVRMVTPSGLISTVAGNGSFGSPDGSQAIAAPFSDPGSLTFDSADNLYISSQDYPQIYRVAGGTIRRLSGTTSGPLTDGSPANSAAFFTTGLRVDANGDLYAVDQFNNVVRKLIVNSPTGITVSDGDHQTGTASQLLPKLLKVLVTGRAGTGVPGATVTFAITSGVASLTTATTQTDTNGFAAVGLTPGQPGNVVVAATLSGATLPPVQFTATAVAPCAVPLPSVTSVNTASDFGGSATFAPGSWLEVKGTNLAQTSRLWGGSDFNGSSAPTAVDGVSVTINGKPAFIEYVSPAQINVQAPADTTVGGVPLVVTTASSTSCASSPFTVQEAQVAPGLLAPASFKIGGIQYLVALYSDGVTYVGNAGLIPGVPFRPAAPGDLITAYGVGFGSVVPNSAPGVVVAGANALSTLSISFGTTPAAISYAGLAPGTVGEYQFVFTVPDIPDGDYQLNFRTAGGPLPQTVYLTVRK